MQPFTKAALMAASKIEFSVTWNRLKVARFHLDDLPWWFAALIAIIPKGSLCICVERNYDQEGKEIKRIMTRANHIQTP